MATTIKRNLVLKELDIKEDPTTSKQRVFSITFDKKNGERIYYPRAVSCGLNMDLKANRCRGILAVDKNGNAISHPTPVGIDRIIKYNDLSVIF
jgi:hypothetical protein